MLTDTQTDLRNALAEKLLDAITDKRVNVVQAYVACIGAAAIVLAVLPEESREALVDATEGTILAHANKRAVEMRSGALDREMIGN
jgi:hypothetical protein